MVYLYVLECFDRSYYTGITNNIIRRLLEHASAHKGYTSFHRVRRLIYLRSFPNYRAAHRFESNIKRIGWRKWHARETYTYHHKNWSVDITLTSCPLALKSFNDKGLDKS